MNRALFIIVSLISFNLLANEDKAALKDTFKLFYNGATEQFKEPNNLYYLIPAVSTTYYAFENDQKLSDEQRSKKLRKIYDVTGDLGILFNFPVVPISLYYYGKNKDEKIVQFAKEYMAAMYLTLFETGIISQIPSHERPNKENQSVWETAFRGKNSFPSGHIVPYSVLFFKTMQFYGPTWAILPAALTYFSSMQRVREGRHFVSDVVGAFWLSAFASEGVRRSANYSGNSSFYKRYFENSLEVSFIHHNGVIGPAFTYKF